MNSKLLIGASGLMLLASCQTEKRNSSEEVQKPNIILILADDLGFSDIGSFGSEIHTPNLDSLAENGIRFMNFHNTSKCFPSRACLLTGLYAQQNGYAKTHTNPITNAATFGEVLRPAGYRTLWSGKHHGLENPVTRGFDRYYGLKDGAANFFNPGRQRPGEGKPAQKRNNRQWCIDSVMYVPYTPESEDFYSTDYFTNYALDWLEEYKHEDKPYILYLAYTAPHDPLQAWPEDIAKYEGSYMQGYEKIRKARYEKQKQIGIIDDKYELSDSVYTPWESLSDSQKVEEDLTMAVYAAMIDRMDWNIGRVLEKVRELNEVDNTLVIFVSDNGASAEVVNIPDYGPIGSMTDWTSLGPDWANVGNTPFRYFKNYSYEGGTRTPMIAWWPSGIKAPGRISEFPGHFIDFMATFTDITGAEYPDSIHGQKVYPMEGESLLPVFRDEYTSHREKPLYFQWSKGSALLEDGWKIVKHGHDNPWDLYHLKEDPAEIQNLSGRYPEKVDSLASKFRKWSNKWEN